MDTTALDAYADKVYDYANSGVTAAERGNFENAATIWGNILADQRMKSCFSREELDDLALRHRVATGNVAARRADYDSAITAWSAVLGGDLVSKLFEPSEVKDIAYNLALAYHRAGNVAMRDQTVSDWRIDDKDQAEIRESPTN